MGGIIGVKQLSKKGVPKRGNKRILYGEKNKNLHFFGDVQLILEDVFNTKNRRKIPGNSVVKFQNTCNKDMILKP